MRSIIEVDDPKGGEIHFTYKLLNLHNRQDNKEFIKISIDGMRALIDGESSDDFKTFVIPLI